MMENEAQLDDEFDGNNLNLIDSSEKNISFFALFFFIVFTILLFLFLVFKNNKAYNQYKSFSLDNIKSFKTSLFFNNSRNDLYLLLKVRLLHNSTKNQKMLASINMNSEYFLNGNTIKIADSKIKKEIFYNSQYIPIFFTYFNSKNISMVINFTSFTSKPFIEFVEFKWESVPYNLISKAMRINKIMFFLNLIISLYWNYAYCFKWNHLKSVRTKMTAILLFSNILNHLPLDIFVEPYHLELILICLRSLSFFIYFIFLNLKCFEWHINELRKSTAFTPLIFGIVSCLLYIYYRIQSEFDLLSLPYSSNGLYENENQILKFVTYFILASSLFQIMIDAIDHFAKLEGIQQTAFMLDISLFLVVSAVYSITSLKKLNRKVHIKDPFENEILQIMYDLIIFYEIIAVYQEYQESSNPYVVL